MVTLIQGRIQVTDGIYCSIENRLDFGRISRFKLPQNFGRYQTFFININISRTLLREDIVGLNIT